MNNNIRKRNTPIVTLLKNFVDKKSGKVSDSRKEIQKRFDFLDWKDQKKIIFVFLDSAKTDRQWAYKKLLDYWDKSFEAKLRELWETLHEDLCSWPVIRHFPEEYLSQNIDQFTNGRDYYFICLRLAKDNNFAIDRSRLSDTDYLAVLCHTGRTIDADEAEDILYKIVHDVCIDSSTYIALNEYVDTSRGSIITPFWFEIVNTTLYYIKLLKHLEVFDRFQEWNKAVQEAILNSPEYKTMSICDGYDYEYLLRKIKLAQKYGYILLDEKYKKDDSKEPEPIIEEKEVKHMDLAEFKKMIEKNRAIGRLLDELDLIECEREAPF